jgi:hypothetical protein
MEVRSILFGRCVRLGLVQRGFLERYHKDDDFLNHIVTDV